MSGPKVVRVITREERVAESTAILAQLDRALARWQKAVTADEQDATTVLAAAATRRAELTAVLEADRFAQFNRAAQRELAFLAGDVEQRGERVALRRAQASATRLRIRQNADLLLQALADQGIAHDASLLQSLAAAARGKVDEAAAEQALAAGFRLLADRKEGRHLTNEQAALAKRLAGGDVDSGLAQWTAGSAGQVDDARLVSLTQQLERLRLAEGEAATVLAFEDRLGRVLAERSADRRSMVLDTLLVDLSAAVQSAKAAATSLAQAHMLIDELARIAGDEASAARTQLQQCVASGALESLASQIEASRGLVQNAARADAARSRRAAVLQGLASLGYTVHEGMETVWVDQGRVVVHKPGLDGYAVELSGAPAAERLQVRTVALAPSRDTARDTDAERVGCGDFSQLKDGLALVGTEVFIDKAMGVGVVPLKVVEASDTAPYRATRPLLKAR